MSKLTLSAQKPKRLASLDILRGLDLFFLVGLESVMHALSGAVEGEKFQALM